MMKRQAVAAAALLCAAVGVTAERGPRVDRLEGWNVAAGRAEMADGSIAIEPPADLFHETVLGQGEDLRLVLDVEGGRTSAYLTLEDARGTPYLSDTRRYDAGRHEWRIPFASWTVAHWAHDPDHHFDTPTRTLGIFFRGDAARVLIRTLEILPAEPPDIGELERARSFWAASLASENRAPESPTPGDPDPVEPAAEAAGAIAVETGRYRATIDAATGTLRELAAGGAAWRQESSRAAELVAEDGTYVRFDLPPVVERPGGGRLVFQFDDGAGHLARLTYRFGRTSVTARWHVRNDGDAPILWLRYPLGARLPMSDGDALIWPRLGGVLLRRSFLAQERSIAAWYPSDLFSDYLCLRSGPDALAFGVIQDLPRFQPAVHLLGTAAEGEASAGFTHETPLYIPPGAAADTATFAWWFADDDRAALRAYAAANGLDTIPPLVRRMDRSLFTRLSRAALLKIDIDRVASDPGAGNVFLAAWEQVSRLPQPLLMHPVTYWEPPGRGATPDRIFDKNHPNFLPANAAFGGDDGFREFVRLCRRRGCPVMPYTNFTAWDRDARGFEDWGDGIAALLPSGHRATGWGMLSACMTHPVVRRVSREIARRFADDMKVDVIFEDQVGARSHLFDLNPASPHPAGYCEALLRHACEMRQILPVITERGFDHLTRHVIGFSGVELGLACTRFMQGWEWDHRYGEGTWEMYPLAEYLAHDLAFFYHHNLGQFVLDRWDLGWCLARGTHLQSYLHAPEDWLWLNAVLQQHLGWFYAGRKLDSFRWLTPEVSESVFEGSIRIVVNHSRTQPYRTETRTVLPPGGFLARGATGKERVVAGWLRALEGEPVREGGPFAIVEEFDRITLVDPLRVGHTITYKPEIKERPPGVAMLDFADGSPSRRSNLARLGDRFLLELPEGAWRLVAW